MAGLLSHDLGLIIVQLDAADEKQLRLIVFDDSVVNYIAEIKMFNLEIIIEEKVIVRFNQPNHNLCVSVVTVILIAKKIKRIPAESKPKGTKTLNKNYPLIHTNKHFINGTKQHRVDCDKSRKSMCLRNWLLEFIKTNVTDVNHS